MKLPINKLLDSINQTNSGHLTYFCYKLFDRATEANVYAIKLRRLRMQVLNFLYFSSFIFKENQFSMKKKTLHKKLL